MDKQEYQARVAWLRRYQDAVRKRQNLVLRLHEAKDAAVHISPAMSSVRCQKTDGVSATQRAVERIEDAQEKLLEQEEICKEIHSQIYRAINELENEQERTALRMRYILFLPMNSIAYHLDVSIATAKRLHRQALKKIHCNDPLVGIK